MKIFDREPALIVELARTILVLVVVFGVELSPEQTAAILATVSAILSVIVRHKVTPKLPAKPPPPKTDEKA